ncbi:hypothetical protein A2572_03260 [Candidatus Collierbacteria bacterium RIFOXYD1_FULL_40_9]|uniref:Uncharacterized protein n=1 Tax=Candidatus Collierbacteria bacterium RIFOXYD1_FULL_40_9 TaxID=1817731 RepID=A0A1F5FWY9_9BACT|nr:MAG: hypothetical protein A2572_03260 [Candidatus Collierbacteria bacterium RIFOXYD1_FULL_40_9]
MKLKFLKPQARNLLITFVILLLPLIREQAPSETGGISVAHYSPIFLLSTYLQMGDYYPFLLMAGFSFAVYVGVSVVLSIVSKVFTKMKK